MASPDSDAASEGSEISFPLPKGYNPPASAKDGKEFTAIATFQIDDSEGEEGPMMTLTKIEGVAVSSEAPEQGEPTPETSPEMMNALQQSGGMPAAGA